MKRGWIVYSLMFLLFLEIVLAAGDCADVMNMLPYCYNDDETCSFNPVIQPEYKHTICWELGCVFSGENTEDLYDDKCKGTPDQDKCPNVSEYKFTGSQYNGGRKALCEKFDCVFVDGNSGNINSPDGDLCLPSDSCEECEDLNKKCGELINNCGEILNCGECNEGTACNENGDCANQCMDLKLFPSSYSFKNIGGAITRQLICESAGCNFAKDLLDEYDHLRETCTGTSTQCPSLIGGDQLAGQYNSNAKELCESVEGCYFTDGGDNTLAGDSCDDCIPNGCPLGYGSDGCGGSCGIASGEQLGKIISAYSAEALGHASSIVKVGDLVFLASGGEGLQIINVSDPSKLKASNYNIKKKGVTVDITHVKDISVLGQGPNDVKLILTDTKAGLQKISVDKNSLKSTLILHNPDSTEYGMISNQLGSGSSAKYFVGSGGEQKVSRLNTAPLTLSSTLEFENDVTSVIGTNNLLVVTTTQKTNFYSCNPTCNPAGNKSNPNGGPHDALAKSNILYQVTFGKLIIINGDVPTIDIPGEGWGLDIYKDKLYIADGLSGLSVVGISNPKEPVYIGSIPTKDTLEGARDVVVDFPYAYVADWSENLQIICLDLNEGSTTYCGDVGPKLELTEETCGDNYDNDQDGFIDCHDPDCQGIVCNLEGSECQYGMEYIEATQFCKETNCNDTIDNNGNGLIDCENGASCAMSPNCIEFPNCHDKDDNDLDLNKDCIDLDCSIDEGCCYDPDNGLAPRGTVLDMSKYIKSGIEDAWSYTFDDVCSPDNTKVREQICAANGEHPDESVLDCELGCFDGACICENDDTCPYGYACKAATDEPIYEESTELVPGEDKENYCSNSFETSYCENWRIATKEEGIVYEPEEKMWVAGIKEEECEFTDCPDGCSDGDENCGCVILCPPEQGLTVGLNGIDVSDWGSYEDVWDQLIFEHKVLCVCEDEPPKQCLATCIDSDPEKDPFVKGHIVGEEIFQSGEHPFSWLAKGNDDHCQGYYKVWEYFCVDETKYNKVAKDCPAETICENGKCKENNCLDGKDNDNDQCIDNVDSDCSDKVDNYAFEGTKEKTCNDGLDNDCDGDFDCADDNCKGAGIETTCTGGIDEDCDGFIDCEDSDCNLKACGGKGMICADNECTEIKGPGQASIQEDIFVQIFSYKDFLEELNKCEVTKEAGVCNIVCGTKTCIFADGGRNSCSEEGSTKCTCC
jgi:hypothetical protein